MDNARVAIAGIGNNVSALVQGVYLCRDLDSEQAELPGIRNQVIDGFGVTDIDFVAGFDIAEAKVGQDLSRAVFAAPNNYPRLDTVIPPLDVIVEPGLTSPAEHQVEAVASALERSRAEVLLYSAPTGLPLAAAGYAEAALAAGIGFVNTTPEVIGRLPSWTSRFAQAGLPLIGDDLVSQFGTSAVHRALLDLLEQRGLTLVSSYQFNVGGNQDFLNLTRHGNAKKISKLNAVAADDATRDKVHMMPFGYLPAAGDEKTAHVNVSGMGWGGTPISLDVTLRVHDSSGAAGVTIDLLRYAVGAKRSGRGGFDPRALGLLKSPPGTHT